MPIERGKRCACSRITARFVLDDADDLSARLKHLRHDLTTVHPMLGLADAILHRDTPGDVGTTIKTVAEMRQHGKIIDQVVIAAGKRLGEALRAIEEFTKTFSSATCDIGTRISIRYRFYDIEQAIARTLRPAKRLWKKFESLLADHRKCLQKAVDWLKTAEAAIRRRGGYALQVREKTLESGRITATGERSWFSGLPQTRCAVDHQ